MRRTRQRPRATAGPTLRTRNTHTTPLASMTQNIAASLRHACTCSRSFFPMQPTTRFQIQALWCCVHFRFPAVFCPPHYYYYYFCTHAGKVVFKLFQEHIGEKIYLHVYNLPKQPANCIFGLAVMLFFFFFFRQPQNAHSNVESASPRYEQDVETYTLYRLVWTGLLRKFKLPLVPVPLKAFLLFIIVGLLSVRVTVTCMFRHAAM